MEKLYIVYISYVQYVFGQRLIKEIRMRARDSCHPLFSETDNQSIKKTTPRDLYKMNCLRKHVQRASK